MSAKKHIISKVVAGSIAEQLELEPGDCLLAINGQKIEDVFDYQYLVNDEYLLVLVQKSDGEEWELEIEKDYNADLGIEFENGLMDEYRSCCNKCMFCFIDQMPKGMRETLYFKDDDSRLSFLQGNYVTLTNMKDKDIDRIIHYHLAPINVSVHTTNPKLRCKMLHNRFAGEALKKITRLSDAGIEMNGQVVLCKGVNDGAELERTIRDLTAYVPQMQSVSIVPVGLSKYRDGLYPLEPFNKEDARAVLACIHKWQDYCMEHFGIHFIHAGDEWYLLAEEELPKEDRYDGYIQLENGVGMITLLRDEFAKALQLAKEDEHLTRSVTLVTGRLAAPILLELTDLLSVKFPGIKVQVIPIRNDFFGENITVAGLLTGQDIISQLRDKDLGDVVLLPGNLLRSGEEVLLDDVTLTDLKRTLQVKIDIVKSSGQDLLDAITGCNS
jgi:putative radical SAM enzyme (TIGR03279 family)